MSLSDTTKKRIGREDLPSRDDELGNALGVQTTVIKQAELSKAEQELLQTNNALSVEDNDPFFTMYEITQQNALIKPTYDPWRLATLTHTNNTLLQCVSAMEINIDGTGYEVEPRDLTPLEEVVRSEVGGETKTSEAMDSLEEGVEEDEVEESEEYQARLQELKDERDEIKKGIEDFFDEPWPRMSFTTIRRKLRRDVETLGNAYLEVIRNASGDIVFLNYLDAKLVRMVRLGKPIEVEETVTRFGTESTVKTLRRERRYAMLVGARTTVSNVSRVMYFRQFGASRHLNKWTGLWEGEEGTPNTGPRAAGAAGGDAPAGVSPTGPTTQALPVPGISDANPGQGTEVGGPVLPPDRATEIIHFTAIQDIGTLYGVPRWINQIPSVLGSRKAEEQNLEFFNSGGVPPVMILIQGGSLSQEARKALTGYLSGQSKYKQRGVIAELYSTSGDLTSAGQVKVSVERFGAERQQDAMFMKYNDQCHHHVRMAFRLAPLFIGDSKEHNFATAKASYMVTEAQVFEPERDEFDEIINTHIMSEIAPEWVYRSKTLSINDTEQQIKALEISKDKVDQECWVQSLGEIAHLELECAEHAGPDQIAMEVAQRMGMTEGQPGSVQTGEDGDPVQRVDVEGDEDGNIAKLDGGLLDELADDWACWLDGTKDFSKGSVEAMRMMIDNLAPSVRKMFNGYVAMKTLSGAHRDLEGTADLLGCATEKMSDKELQSNDLL